MAASSFERAPREIEIAASSALDTVPRSCFQVASDLSNWQANT